MTTLGFCGLGKMGLPMVTRLIEAGHSVNVWNRTPDKAAALVAQGATLAATPAEAARGSELVLTMLSTPEAVEAVIFGQHGLAEGLEQGATLVEMSTIGPAAVRQIAERLPAGVTLLDAPVKGSVPQATAGKLRLLIGGPRPSFERWQPVLDVLGSSVYAGDTGSGAALKLVLNSGLGAVIVALGEALALADRLGVDQEIALMMLGETALGPITNGNREQIEQGSYPPTFKLELARKDLDLVAAAAAERSLTLPVSQAARGWLSAAEREGLGELDFAAVVAYIRQLPAADGSAS